MSRDTPPRADVSLSFSKNTVCLSPCFLRRLYGRRNLANRFFVEFLRSWNKRSSRAVSFVLQPQSFRNPLINHDDIIPALSPHLLHCRPPPFTKANNTKAIAAPRPLVTAGVETPPKLQHRSVFRLRRHCISDLPDRSFGSSLMILSKCLPSFSPEASLTTTSAGVPSSLSSCVVPRSRVVGVVSMSRSAVCSRRHHQSKRNSRRHHHGHGHHHHSHHHHSRHRHSHHHHRHYHRHHRHYHHHHHSRLKSYVTMNWPGWLMNRQPVLRCLFDHHLVLEWLLGVQLVLEWILGF